MKEYEIITNELKNLEAEKGIKILFAVENGSRAWGLESKDSDYDIRFVYYWPLIEYLRLNRPEETIMFNNENRDYVGFDIYKFAKLLSKSNPTVIEWLNTNIIYYGRQDPELKKWSRKPNLKALYHRYRSMCKDNYLKYLKSGKLVSYKKYLYAYRGLINARYVIENKKVPPIKLISALKSVKIPERIKNKIINIIMLKKEGNENKIISNISFLDRYIEKFLKENKEPETRITNPRAIEKRVIEIITGNK